MMGSLKDGTGYMKDYMNAENVTFSYEAQEEEETVEVLHGVSLGIRKGEFVALLGHNGSGKSTMAKQFNAMLLPSGGKVYVDGLDTLDEDLKIEIRRRVGLVLQNPDNQLVASIVEEDVAFGPENLGVAPPEIRERVDEALKAVEMYDYRLHAPYKLSGGQKQRIAIAGIIAMQPDCIVLDEPTAMLDPRGRDEVLETIHRLNREKGITIVLITHYMDEAVGADRVIVMDDGRILTQGTPREVFSQVELLKAHQLDVPQSTELIYRLKAAGIPLPDGVLNIEECVAALEPQMNRTER
ncbi:energy-coupling factor transporter ATPase [Caproicibacter sp.]|uniref:energy-coupling factor transporter ATPase n=1 Tax=Caproicibacter sp. TaxID=2814884 RepID=UPI00398A3FFE